MKPLKGTVLTLALALATAMDGGDTRKLVREQDDTSRRRVPDSDSISKGASWIGRREATRDRYEVVQRPTCSINPSSSPTGLFTRGLTAWLAKVPSGGTPISARTMSCGVS